jgi:iron complex transport system substrate-binding protein
MHVSRTGALAAWALAMAVMAAIMPGAAVAAAEVVVVDAGGRSVRVADASRILSIGGDVTEIVYALGAGDRVVGVDTTSQFPPEALAEKKTVGYMRALSSEGVISVGATLVLASERAGPPEVVKTRKATSVPYVEVPDEPSQAGILKTVRLVARAIGREAEGEKLARKVAADFEALSEQRAKIRRPVRALFVLGVQNGRVMVGGQATSADAILKLAGAQNVAAGVTGFRPVADEALVQMAPEVIVTMRRSGDGDAHDVSQLFALKGIASTPAGATRRILAMDGLLMLGFGPRTPAAARELMGLFHPDPDAKAAGGAR